MLEMLSRNWWMLLVRGFAAILLGLSALLLPGITLDVLVTVFAAYLIVDGFFLIVGAITGRAYSRWWLTLLEGVLGIFAGIAAFLFPGAAVLTFFYIVAAWAVITGAFQIINAIELRRQIDNEWWMILGGAISILWGGLLIARPAEGILTLLWLFGIAAIIFGVMLALLAFRVRGMRGTRAAA
ncbi:MAG: HdeD family acid-resistance protein [Anaerolineae bacterium]|nr:HdeD family acid-resistance protein [Anaerolineae bacterium]